MALRNQSATGGLSNRAAEFVNQLGLAWWVQVTTQQPKCTYYFGPFLSAQAAQQALPGYVEDLEVEQAQGIKAEIKRCKPTQLTLEEF
uniref:DUF1816 domain-containing protein n=1 Tax=Petrachloros mirabilis TaxID=2918835 RepID=UPI00308454F0